MSQVNLLPPELRARQKTKQLTTLIIGAGAAVVVLLIAFWFLQSQKLAGINDDIAAQTLTNTELQTQIDQLQEFQQLQEQAAAQEALLAKAWVGEVSFSEMLMDLSRTIPSDAYLDSFNATLAVPVTTGRSPTHDDVRRRVHGRGGGRRFREPGELDHAPRIGEGLGEPVGLECYRDRREHRAVHVHAAGSTYRTTRSRRAVEGTCRVGGKRAPLFAGIGVAVVVVLVAFFLVLPKMGQVKDANAALADAQSQAGDAWGAVGGPPGGADRGAGEPGDHPQGPAGDPADRRPAGVHAADAERGRAVGGRRRHDLPGQPGLRPGHRALDGDELDLGHRDATSRSRSSCSRSRPFRVPRRRVTCRSRRPRRTPTRAC